MWKPVDNVGVQAAPSDATEYSPSNVIAVQHTVRQRYGETVEILADDKIQHIFGAKQMAMFQMTKAVNKHLK